MSGFAKCVIWLLALALLAHPLGQALPRRWFDGERFPYRCYKWEKQGRIYTCIGVERWKTLVPDMSRLLPDMVKKQVDPTAVTAAPSKTASRARFSFCARSFSREKSSLFIAHPPRWGCSI